jgi:hypothetical protein
VVAAAAVESAINPQRQFPTLEQERESSLKWITEDCGRAKFRHHSISHDVSVRICRSSVSLPANANMQIKLIIAVSEVGWSYETRRS